MKYLKILGLVIIVTMALAAFAALASATVLKSGGSALGVGSELELSLSSGTSSYFKSTGGSTLNTCTLGTIAGKIENAGGSTATVSWKSQSFSLLGCVSTIHTVSAGSLEIHHIAGTTNGTVTASGAVLNNTIFGTSCLYESGTAKDLGTLVGGTPATLSINITVNEAEPKKAICPDETSWEAKFAATKPIELVIEAS